MQADKSNIHVLMTADTVGGVWTYCMDLCRAMEPFGVQFYLVTTGAPLHEGQWVEVAQLANVVVYETAYKLEWMQDPWSDIETSGAWLLQLEKELKPDIIHLNSYSYGNLPFTAPKIVVAHSDVFSWWWAVKGQMPPAEWKEYYQRVSNGLAGADLIVAPSFTMMRNISTLYMPQVPCRVIYNWRQKPVEYNKAKELVVLSVGRIWDEAKNIHLLLQAAGQVNSKIRIAGDAAFDQNTLTMHCTNVAFLGRLQPHEVGWQMAAASVYALPAKYEPFGLSILEAALAGCALVLGDIPSLREVWKDAAVYVPVDDAHALAFAINQLLEDKVLRDDYAQKAQKQAQLFSVTNQAPKYLQLYRQLHQEKALLHQEII